MAKMKLTDANGKLFEVSLDQIRDMSFGESPVSIEDSVSPSRPHSVRMLDTAGEVIDVRQLLDAAAKDKGMMPTCVDATWEATHSGSNRNSTIYHSDSMKKDAITFQVPFAKPLLKNHDSWSEPMGRVREAHFGPSILNPERDTIKVTWRITDREAIEKLMDGRYHTMSIGANANHISCCICGKDIYKDGKMEFCGHWRGETYNNVLCKWNARDLEYKEGSIVNSPADDWAQLIELKVISEDDSQRDSGKGGNQMDQINDNSQSQDTSLLDAIDNLTAPAAKVDEGQQTDENSSAEAEPKDETEDETSGTSSEADEADGKEDPANTEDAEIKALQDENVRLQTENDVLKADNAALTDEVETLKTKVTDLEAKLAESKKTEDSLKTELGAADAEAKQNRSQAVQLAMANKELMSHRIADHQIVQGLIKTEDREKTVGELKLKSAKDLNDSLFELSKKQPMTRIPITVLSPALNNPNDAHAIIEGEQADGHTKEDPTSTLADFAEGIVDNLLNR